MACLDNIVGIDASCEESNSSFNLSDVGLYEHELNDYVGKGFSNGIALGLAKIETAKTLTMSDIHNAFSKKYIVNSVLENKTIGYYQNNLVEKTNEDDYSGLEVYIDCLNSYLDIYISTLSVQVKHTGDINIYIYDSIANTLKDTIVVSAVSGEIVTVDVNKLYKSNKQKLHLAIVIDASVVPTSYYSIAKNGSCISCDGNGLVSLNSYVKARGIKVSGSNFTKQNLYGQTHTSGISINYSLQCNHDDWVCQYRNKLVLPIAYKAASEVMKYALFTSERFNSKTTLDFEKLKARLGEYEMLYNQHIEKLLNSVSIPNDRNCFECKTPLRYRVTRP